MLLDKQIKRELSNLNNRLKSLETEIKALREIENLKMLGKPKCNEMDFLRDSVLIFILGTVFGFMLFQFGTDLLQ